MDNTLKLEAYIFLTSIYGGLIGGLVYDIYRVMRYYSKPKKLGTFIEDFLFWIGMALIFFYVLIKSNWGEIRGYIILGFILGSFVYIKILSKVVYSILIKVCKWILKGTNKIIKTIKFPFSYLKNKLSPKVRKIKRIPLEAVKEIKKYKKIISQKK
ncbi:spore cortex biosynthesis protein YabQ [Tissierella sp. MSJ-40]|uniref:Spore cortex biosynthesis protein YabQ n=1 Tax=Tissierella simiarum TaxID=2841534 RepID=A0ABS6E8P6_9FIRM|nr:spore cortex biosynthesis protein YabQ [Tissierella simiarum]MBU5439295.1 spore cortex biosynthesis protein YabQ [Tissierella simiarum]